MPIAASTSADTPKIVISSMFSRWRDVLTETMSSMFWTFVTGTPVVSPDHILDLLRNRSRLDGRAHDPTHGPCAVHQHVQRVRHLRERQVHHRPGILRDAAGTHVADNADDLPHGLGRELLHDGRAAAHGNLIRERIAAVLPVLLRHGLVDDDDGRARGRIGVVERAAADDGDLERIEVARDGEVDAATARERTFIGAADDVERQAVAALQRHAARHRRGGDAGNLPDAFERQARGLIGGRGRLVPRPRQRRAHDRARSRSCSPGSTPPSASDVRINSAAPTSSTTARLTSTSTSTERVLFWRKPLPERLLESLMIAFRSARDATSAGIKPNMMPGDDRQARA